MHTFIKNLLNGQAVEWRTLGEVAVIGTGNSNRQDESENGDYPFYVRSKNVLRSDSYQFDETAIVIPGEGGIGDIFHYVEGKYALHQRAYRICIHDGDINTKFLYHVMSNSFKQYILSKSVGATATSIRKPMLEKFQIPIPPLSVQSQIVQILDTFTELTAELTAELSMRQKQYQYYRDFLLSEHELAKVGFEWKRLGEVFHLKNGYTPSKSNKEYWENGTIPWFRMEDIRENGRILDYALQQVSESAVKGGKLFPANSIIMATTATIGEHALVTVNCLSNQQLTNFSIKNEFSKLLDIKFAFHYFFIIDEQAKKIANKSSMPIISLKELSKLLIPIPPLSVQSEIVAILDTFDTLVSSISEGLPKEIQLRQKQYEYYRELLLDFHPNQE